MKKFLTLAVILTVLFISCTDNQRARRFGGTETIKIESQEKFINIAWKDDDLWVVLQDTVSGVIYAKEKSSFGVWEGMVVIQK